MSSCLPNMVSLVNEGFARVRGGRAEMGSCIQGQGRSERKTPPVARPWRSRPSFWERDLEVRQQKKKKNQMEELT